jgi:hypothetical protein
VPVEIGELIVVTFPVVVLGLMAQLNKAWRYYIH